MKVAIYARVSTAGQELDHQIMACRKLAEAKDLEVGEVYQDIGSGMKFTRPQFQIMLHRLRSRDYDGVIAFKLDRLGRRAGDLGLLLEELENRGIRIFTVYDNWDTGTPIGRAMRAVAVAFAELERENISEATKQRLESLKASGKKLGRKPVPANKIRKVLTLRARELTYREIKAETRLSIGTITNIIKGKPEEDNGE